MTLRAASGGRLRPSLTAAARGALLTPGRDGETAPVSRTEKRYQVGSVRQTSKGRTFLPTPDSEEAINQYSGPARYLGQEHVGRKLGAIGPHVYPLEQMGPIAQRRLDHRMRLLG